MNTDQITFEPDEIPIAHFCALRYETQEMTGPSAPEKIIVLLIRYENGTLRVLSRQDWPSIIQPKDLEYIRDLLADFKERASSAPDVLFRQVSSLSVGPLVTHAVGSRFDLKNSMDLVDVFANMADVG